MLFSLGKENAAVPSASNAVASSRNESSQSSPSNLESSRSEATAYAGSNDKRYELLGNSQLLFSAEAVQFGAIHSQFGFDARALRRCNEERNQQ
jgi:hypothetical protein